MATFNFKDVKLQADTVKKKKKGKVLDLPEKQCWFPPPELLCWTANISVLPGSDMPSWPDMN